MNRIEKKVPIAADAAITISSYLEELNQRLTEVGIDNAYSIVAGVEEILIDMLQSLEKTTKITTEEVLKIIEEIGTPEVFVKNYIEEQNLGIDYEAYMKNPARGMPRKKRIRKQLVSRQDPPLTPVSRFIKWVLRLAMLLMVLALVMQIHNTFRSPFAESFTIFEYIDYYITKTELIAVYATAFYIIAGVLSALTNESPYTVEKQIKLRTRFRAMLFTKIQLQYYRILVLFVYFPYDHFSYMEQEIMLLDVYLFIALEIIIFIRDHTFLSPLEKSFQPFIRYFTLHYILLYLAILLTYIIPRDAQSFYVTLFNLPTFILGGICAAVASIYAKLNRFPVSIRFHSFVASLLIPFAIYERETMDTNYLAIISIIWIVIHVVIEYKRNPKKVENIVFFPFRFIKTMVNRYHSLVNDYKLHN